ncbi:uncharacterized protein ACN2A1_006422 [Glossina fuscipes fuscipes]
MDDKPSSSRKDQRRGSIYTRHISFLTDKGTDNFPKIEKKKRASAPENIKSNSLKNNEQREKQPSFKEIETKNTAANDAEEKKDGSTVNNGNEKKEEIEVARAALLDDNKNEIDVRDGTGNENGKDFSTDSNDNQDGDGEQNHAKRSTYDEENDEQSEKQSSFKQDEVENAVANESEEKKDDYTVNNGKEKKEEIEVARAALLDDNKNEIDVRDETGNENGKDFSTDSNDNQDGNGEQNHARRSTYDEEYDEQSEKQTSFNEDKIEETTINGKQKKEEIEVGRTALLDDNKTKIDVRDETGNENGKDFSTDNNDNQNGNDERNRAKRSTYEEGNSEQSGEKTSFKENETEANEEKRDSSTVNNVKKEKADVEILRANSLEDNDTNLTDATENTNELLTRESRKTQTDEYLINHVDIDQHRSGSIEDTILKTNGIEKQTEKHEDVEVVPLKVSTKDDKKGEEEVKDIGTVLLDAYDATENDDALVVSSEEQDKRRTADTAILDEEVIKKQSVNKDENGLTTEEGKKAEEEIFDGLRYNVGKDSAKTKDAITSTIEEGECPPLYLMQNALKGKKKLKGIKPAVTSLIERGNEEQNASLERQTIDVIEKQDTLLKATGERDRRITKVEETSTSKVEQKERRQSRDAETTLSEDKLNIFVDNTVAQKGLLTSNGEKEEEKTRYARTRPSYVETERHQYIDAKQSNGKEQTKEAETILMKDKETQSGNLEHHKLHVSNNYKAIDKTNENVTTQTDYRTTEYGSKEMLIETKTYPPPALLYHVPQQRREDHPIPGTSQEMTTFCHSCQCRREQPRFSQPAEMMQGYDVANNCSTYFMRVCNRDTSIDEMRKKRIYDATRTQDELHRENHWDLDNEPHSSNRMPRMYYSRERMKRSPQEMEIRKQLGKDEMLAETSNNKYQHNQESCYSATNKQNDGRSRDFYKEYDYSPHSAMDDMNIMKRSVHRLCRHDNGGNRCDEFHTYKYIPQNVKDEIPPGNRRYVSLNHEEAKGYENNFENWKKAKNSRDENHQTQYFAQPVRERSSYSLGCRSVCIKNGQQTFCSTQCVECSKQNSAHRQYVRKDINERENSCESLNREFDACQRNRSNTSSEYNRGPYERQEDTFQQTSCEGVEETVTRPSVIKCLMEYLEGKLRCNFINRLKEYDIFNYIHQNSQNVRSIEARENNATNLENNSPNSEHNREPSPTLFVESEKKRLSQPFVQNSHHNGRVNISNVSINEINSSESQQSIKNIKIEFEIHTPKTVHKRGKEQDIEVIASDLGHSQEKALAMVTAFNEENLRRNSSTHQGEKILCPPVSIRNDANSENEAPYFMYTGAAASSFQTPRRKRIVAAYVKEQRIDNSVAPTSEEKLRGNFAPCIPLTTSSQSTNNAY